MRVHTLPRGESIAPMPKMRDGEIGRRVQGGMPPVPYRTATKRWGDCPAKSARDPMKTILTDWSGVRR